jgi:glycosyltransferase involved in cell wall biosynthesis
MSMLGPVPEQQSRSQRIHAMIVAVCFTNFGPYHLARLRVLAQRLSVDGDGLIAYEVAGGELRYPWERRKVNEPFDWITLFPEQVLESLSAAKCVQALVQALERDLPDAVGIIGYSRPESIAAARWARKNGAAAILMSESQAIDRPRTWWKEMVKRCRLWLFDAALVGGARHRDYLVELGMPADRIALGYNAVDNAYYQERAKFWRGCAKGTEGLPAAPFFLSVCRFVPEKNLIRLVEAFSRYRDVAPPDARWDLVLCGDGPLKAQISTAVSKSGHSEAIHQMGFLQADAIARWYAHASAFVLPSLSEPWGLVVNEAASAGLPLLVSSRAGCVETLVPEPEGTTGARFNPLDVDQMAQRLGWLSGLPKAEQLAMGQRAAEVVAHWGPDRFAEGVTLALELSARRARGPKLVGLERGR